MAYLKLQLGAELGEHDSQVDKDEALGCGWCGLQGALVAGGSFLELAMAAQDDAQVAVRLEMPWRRLDSPPVESSCFCCLRSPQACQHSTPMRYVQCVPPIWGLHECQERSPLQVCLSQRWWDPMAI